MIDGRLNKYINNEKNSIYQNYSLDNIKQVSSLLGRPQDNFNSIHISGTNGKGSVASFLASIFKHSGYKTGIYTSPHLISINERIKINGIQIPDLDFLNILDSIEKIIQSNNISLTYFDILTLVCFLYFKQENVDIAIIEVGLGGKNDSTNILSPLCSVITDISLEHTNILGNTLKEITIEKCGIIKKNIPTVSSNTNSIVSENIIHLAKKNSSTLFLLGRDFFLTKNNLDKKYYYDLAVLKEKFLVEKKQSGEFQYKNISMAITVSLLLKNKFTQITTSSISLAIQNTKIPGRMETISRNPKIIFDPAHNPNAIMELLKSIKNQYPKKNIIFVIGIMQDKNYKEIFQIIQDSCHQTIFFNLKTNRSLKLPSKHKNSFNFNYVTDNINDLKKNIDTFNSDKNIFLVSGSFLLYKEIIKLKK